MPNFSPKIILITGSSSGFGLLTAARLAASGHTVYATMRNLERKDSVLSEVNRRGGGDVHFLELDVTKPTTIKKAVGTIATRHGHLDCLINNAGFGMGGFFEDLTPEEIREQMEVNFFGVQNVTREVIPLMRPRKQGRIINISSIAGRSASPAFGAYNASKWALEGFSESLYHEMQLFGIHVCLIEPGTFKTRIFFDNARYARNFDNPQSPYFDYSQRLRRTVMNFVDNCTKDPELVAKKAEWLIRHPNPPFRTIPDFDTRCFYFFKSIIPFKLFSSVYRQMLHHD